jgi:hypothetical protein
MAQKTRLLRNLAIFGDFCGIFDGLEWFRTYSQLLFKTEGPCCNFSKRTGTAAYFTISLQGFVQNLRDLSNSELFFNGKTSGLGPQCHGPTVQSGPWCTEGGADTRHSGVAPACDAPGATGLRCSPAKTREEEGDEVVPVRGSPELRRWWRGRVMAVENFTSCSR